MWRHEVPEQKGRRAIIIMKHGYIITLFLALYCFWSEDRRSSTTNDRGHGASLETPILTTREGQPIEMIRVFSKPWWEFAVETISDEDAKRILVGK